MIFNQLVEDIREEPSVWSLKLRPKAEDLEDAWRRIASKNNLSALEVKLIFRELSKKYKEECKKPKSTWKLLQALRFLDEDLEDKSDKLKAPAARSTPQPTVPPPPEFPEETKIKEEPQEFIPLSHNTSDDDYVELLEVRDEDYTDEEDGENMMDLDEDLNTNNSKQNALSPVKSSEISHNKGLSVLNPATINNMATKSDGPIASSSTTTSTSKSVTQTTAMKSIPAIFAGMKRKLANGIESQTNGSDVTTQPPEKLLKNFQDNAERGRNSPMQASQRPPTPKLKQITFTPKEIKSIPPTSVRMTNFPPEVGSLPVESKEKPTETVRVEPNGLNIGDVIPMPDTPSINLERAEVDSILEKSTLRVSANENDSQPAPRATQSDNEPASAGYQSTPHSRMYDSFGQYVSNTLNALPDKLANKLEIKILEAIIAVNTEKSNLA